MLSILVLKFQAFARKIIGVTNAGERGPRGYNGPMGMMGPPGLTADEVKASIIYFSMEGDSGNNRALEIRYPKGPPALIPASGPTEDPSLILYGVEKLSREGYEEALEYASAIHAVHPMRVHAIHFTESESGYLSADVRIVISEHVDRYKATTISTHQHYPLEK